MIHLHCQLNRVCNWNYLEDSQLGVTLRVFPEKIHWVGGTCFEWCVVPCHGLGTVLNKREKRREKHSSASLPLGCRYHVAFCCRVSHHRGLYPKPWARANPASRKLCSAGITSQRWEEELTHLSQNFYLRIWSPRVFYDHVLEDLRTASQGF